MYYKGYTDAKSYSDAELAAILCSMLGHSRWFIAGSFATPKVKTPSDIDIFFYDEDGYTAAVEYMKKHEKQHGVFGVSSGFGVYSTTHETDNAITFPNNRLNYTMQLIKKRIGTVQDVLDSFDLNVCKHAILSDGQRYSDPTANLPLKICSINSRTFSRIFKYVGYFDHKIEIPAIAKWLIDEYIGDTTMIEEYYSEQEAAMSVNQSLYITLKDFYSVADYFQEQAAIHAPELLI